MTMLAHVSTNTNLAAKAWVIDEDDVVQLREWGTDTIHALPLPPVDECTVGTAETCTIRLDDPSHQVSYVHARLIWTHATWQLHDLGSKNGVWFDGSRRSHGELTPGLEIGIGGVTLIAESAGSIALRSFLARLLGWGRDRTEIVDLALRSVHMAAARRVALVLCGDGDLVPIARSIHRHSRGADRPFVVCDPRRGRGKATVRSPESYATGMEALATAAGGSLCVRTRRLPPDFREVVDALHAPSSPVQLIVCAEAVEDCERYRVTPIAIPPIAGRAADLDRIIHEYADDALTELAAPPTEFSATDAAWVREHACTSLPEIEKAILRLVALRASRSLGHAAARLGMAPVSLARWIGRRRMPMPIVH